MTSSQHSILRDFAIVRGSIPRVHPGSRDALRRIEEQYENAEAQLGDIRRQMEEQRAEGNWPLSKVVAERNAAENWCDDLQKQLEAAQHRCVFPECVDGEKPPRCGSCGDASRLEGLQEQYAALEKKYAYVVDAHGHWKKLAERFDAEKHGLREQLEAKEAGRGALERDAKRLMNEMFGWRDRAQDAEQLHRDCHESWKALMEQLEAAQRERDERISVESADRYLAHRFNEVWDERELLRRALRGMLELDGYRPRDGSVNPEWEATILAEARAVVGDSNPAKRLPCGHFESDLTSADNVTFCAVCAVTSPATSPSYDIHVNQPNADSQTRHNDESSPASESLCPTCGELASAGHQNASGECSDAIHSNPASRSGS